MRAARFTGVLWFVHDTNKRSKSRKPWGNQKFHPKSDSWTVERFHDCLWGNFIIPLFESMFIPRNESYESTQEFLFTGSEFIIAVGKCIFCDVFLSCHSENFTFPNHFCQFGWTTRNHQSHLQFGLGKHQAVLRWMTGWYWNQTYRVNQWDFLGELSDQQNESKSYYLAFRCLTKWLLYSLYPYIIYPNLVSK